MSKITYNAIRTMINQGNGKGDQFVVKAYNIKNKNNYLRLYIKDDIMESQAAIFLSEQMEHLNIPKVCRPQVCQKVGEGQAYLIKITNYTSHEHKNKEFFIEIIDFQPVEPIIPFVKSESQITSAKVSIKSEEPTQQIGYRTQKKFQQNKKPIEPVSYEPKERIRSEDDNQEIDEVKLRQFQKISDLYIDFQGRWQIVVRVLEKSYRVFNNRSNKITKIFSMTLVDRTGMKIQGVMFGDNAKDYYDMIRQNHIYRMSRGQVRQETYNQNKGSDFSTYNIIFTKNSIFIPVKDLKYIPRSENSDTTIEQVTYESNFQKTYSLAVILLQIGEERYIERERQIYKKNIVVGDPITKKSMDVIIWNKDLLVDFNWEGKTIYLKNFKLNNYRDSFSLYSTFKSEIKPKENHQFTSYEKKVPQGSYEHISEAGANGKTSSADKTLRELQSEINMMNSSDVIYSTVQVWLTHIIFKGKWFYDPCNNAKCKKGAESMSNCVHCGNYNDQLSHRYILPIELSDCTGSIYLSAFDQFGQQILKGESIDDLINMQENQLKLIAECKLYKQYKLKIITKRDAQGNTKHNVLGKTPEVSVQKSCVDSVQKIRRMLIDNKL